MSSAQPAGSFTFNFTCQLMCQELVLSAPSDLKVVLEFDFTQEARVMDTVADNLKVSKTADCCTFTFLGTLARSK